MARKCGSYIECILRHQCRISIIPTVREETSPTSEMRPSHITNRAYRASARERGTTTSRNILTIEYRCRISPSTMRITLNKEWCSNYLSHTEVGRLAENYPCSVHETWYQRHQQQHYTRDKTAFDVNRSGDNRSERLPSFWINTYIGD